MLSLRSRKGRRIGPGVWVLLIGSVPYLSSGPLNEGCERAAVSCFMKSEHEKVPKISMPSFRRLMNLDGHRGAAFAAAFDASGEYLISAGEDAQPRLWDTSDGTLIKKYSSHHYGGVMDILISKNRSCFVTAGADGDVVLWDSTEGKPLKTLRGSRSAINSIAWNGEESILCGGGEDGKIYIWDLLSRSSRPVQVLDEALGAISAVAVKNSIIAAGGMDGFLRLYDIRSGRVLMKTFGGVSLGSISFSRDSRMLLVGCLDSTLRLVDRERGHVLMEYRGHLNTQFRLRSGFLWDDSMVASPSEDGRFFIWNLINGTEKKAYSQDITKHSILFSNQHRYRSSRKERHKALLVAGGINGQVSLWSPDTAS